VYCRPSSVVRRPSSVVRRPTLERSGAFRGLTLAEYTGDSDGLSFQSGSSVGSMPPI
jgi:hypothetical protein